MKQDFAPREGKERWVDSASLFAGQRCLRIRHEAEEYRLTITASGKLILTK